VFCTGEVEVGLERTGEKRIIGNDPLIRKIETIPSGYFFTVNHGASRIPIFVDNGGVAKVAWIVL